MGDYDTAITGLHALLAANPTPDDAKTARFRLGQALLFQGDNTAARQELAGFVQTYPNDALTPAALFMLGRLYYDAEQWDAAADAYGQYVRLGGPLADYAQNRVGNSLNSAKRFADASQAYTAAVQMPQASAPILRAAWHGLGDSREGLGDMAGARAAYTSAFQAATDDEDRAAAVYALYLLDKKLDQDDEARRELERLWTQYPASQAGYQAAQADADEGDAHLLYLKGKVAYERGDFRMTVDALNQAATDDPAHPADTHLFAGEAYRRLGQTGQAVFHYDQLMDTHPGAAEIPVALLGKARALRMSGTLEASLAAMTASWPSIRRTPMPPPSPRWKARDW
ncbi:MAG: tetratricopeptide repeat protein [Anaerolineae bacterium]|nr:tetratricopeptide repeat protein [Anaerolineae bacterium]